MIIEITWIEKNTMVCYWMRDKKDILVEADNLEYSYKDGAVLVPAVEQVSFQIRKGEILAVAGQTGSGKVRCYIC